MDMMPQKPLSSVIKSARCSALGLVKTPDQGLVELHTPYHGKMSTLLCQKAGLPLLRYASLVQQSGLVGRVDRRASFLSTSMADLSTLEPFGVRRDMI